MSDNKKSTAETVKIEIFKFKNHLRAKLGLKRHDPPDGFIDPNAVKEGQQLITDLCKDCTSTLGGHLEKLTSDWKTVQTLTDKKEQAKLSEIMYTTAHEIKDISSLCGYDLIAYFAESLRDYLGLTELNMTAKKVIVQAHLDAITIAQKKNLKDTEDPAAEELKKLVKVAIQKYS